MTYLTTDTIRDVIEASGRRGEEFFEIPEDDFDEFLSRLERESRAIINDILGGEGYEREQEREDLINSPDKRKLQLVYPVTDVLLVEVRTYGDGFTELDSDRYRFDDQFLKLRRSLIRPNPKHYSYGSNNPLTVKSNSLTWDRVSDETRVTYNRGYETANVPQDIKEAQKRIIRKMLVQVRQEQNMANLDPDSFATLNSEALIDQDLRRRIKRISRPKSKYTMLR